MEERRDIFAFTVTRASGEARCRLLQETLVNGRKTAGMSFHWFVYASGVGTSGHKVLESALATKLVDEVVFSDDNVGQHVAWNAAHGRAKEAGYPYFLRLDDDCEFITKRWLRKLYEASVSLDDRFILSPLVRGLNNPPDRSNKVNVKGIDMYLLLEAIGGICRWHPMELLALKEDPFVADVRKPLATGDATGIAYWAKKHVIPFSYLCNVRVRHARTTKIQKEEDAEHFREHGVFQHIPYIPTGGPDSIAAS